MLLLYSCVDWNIYNKVYSRESLKMFLHKLGDGVAQLV